MMTNKGRFNPPVYVHFTTCDLPNTDNFGNEIETPGVIAECQRCHHEVTSFGQHEASFKRSCALLRDECPKGEKNFYTWTSTHGWAVQRRIQTTRE